MKVEWNCEKADTRIILLTSQETNDVVVVAKDTDVLVSLVRTYAYTVSNAICSSNMMPRNMLTYVNSVTTWVKMYVNQYLLFTQ